MSCFLPIGRYEATQSAAIIAKSRKSNTSVRKTQTEMAALEVKTLKKINKIPAFKYMTLQEMSGSGSGLSAIEAKDLSLSDSRRKVACLNNIPNTGEGTWTAEEFNTICQPYCTVSASSSAPTSVTGAPVRQAPAGFLQFINVDGTWSRSTIGVTAAIVTGIYMIVVLLFILCIK